MDILTIWASSFAEMEHVFLESVNMRAVVSDIVLWNALAGSRFATCVYCRTFPTLESEPSHRQKMYMRLGELKRFALPDKRGLHIFRLARNMTDTRGGAQVPARMFLTVESQTSGVPAPLVACFANTGGAREP